MLQYGNDNNTGMSVEVHQNSQTDISLSVMNVILNDRFWYQSQLSLCWRQFTSWTGLQSSTGLTQTPPDNHITSNVESN